MGAHSRMDIAPWDSTCALTAALSVRLVQATLAELPTPICVIAHHLVSPSRFRQAACIFHLAVHPASGLAPAPTRMNTLPSRPQLPELSYFTNINVPTARG